MKNLEGRVQGEGREQTVYIVGGRRESPAPRQHQEETSSALESGRSGSESRGLVHPSQTSDANCFMALSLRLLTCKMGQY